MVDSRLPKLHWASAPALLIAALVGLGLFLLVRHRNSESERKSIVVSHETLELDGETRKYRLAIPLTPPAAPLPIVIALHGVGDTADSIADYSQLDRLAAQGRCYVVYPEARHSMWNVVGISPDNTAENRDLRFIDLLLVRLRRQLASDGLSLVGMSNGATFAQAVLLTRSDIDAVVAHSGAKPDGLEMGEPAARLLLIVGTEDLAAESMRRDAAEYRVAGYSCQLIQVPHLGHQWSTKQDAAIDQFLTPR